MKIYRFRSPGHSYGFIQANIIERFFLRSRIAHGDTGLVSLEQLELNTGGQASAVRHYRAQFVITAKRERRVNVVGDRRRSPRRRNAIPLKQQTTANKVLAVLGKAFSYRVSCIDYK